MEEIVLLNDRRVCDIPIFDNREPFIDLLDDHYDILVDKSPWEKKDHAIYDGMESPVI